MTEYIQSALNTTGLGAMDANMAALAKDKSQLMTRSTANQEAQAASLKEQERLSQEKMAASLPAQEKIATAAKETPAAPKYEEQPKYQKPTMKPEELHEAFGMLMAASMLVGATSRTPYNNAMNAITGAMTGFMQKDDEQAKESLKIFDENFKVIKERNDKMRQEFSDAWEKHKNDMAALHNDYELILQRYDQPIALEALRTKGFSTAQKMLDDQIKSNENLETKNMTIRIHVDEFLAKLEETKARDRENAQYHQDMIQTKKDAVAATNNSGSDKLTEGGMEIYEGMITKGVPIPKTRRGIVDSAVLNNMAVKGVTAGDIASGRGEVKAVTSALTQNQNRMAAVDRITGAVKELESQVLSLAKEVNTSIGGEFGNKTFNDFVSKYGDSPEYAGKITELRNMTSALSREYVIATRMPGSNAQMHTTHSEDADKLFNGDMPINKMAGAIRGINSDISAVEKSISHENDTLLSKLRDGKSSANSPTQADRDWIKVHPEDAQKFKSHFGIDP